MKEAMENINKIDDVILALSTMRDKVTMAVLRGNAGAGGEMLSAACDIVLSHPVSNIQSKLCYLKGIDKSGLRSAVQVTREHCALVPCFCWRSSLDTGIQGKCKLAITLHF